MANLSRRELLRKFVGAAALTATTGSFLNVAMGGPESNAKADKNAKRGTKVKLGLKGGGSVELTNVGKDKWTAVVVDGRERIAKPTGLLLLDNGKVIGLKKGSLSLGQFGNKLGNANFQETVFTETVFNESVGSRVLPVARQVVLPRQVKDLKGLKSLQVTPKFQLNPQKIDASKVSP